MTPVRAAAIVVFCEGMVLWAVFPIMHSYCAELGGGPIWVGLLFALLSAPRVVSSPIFGRLSERFGRRPLMALASLGTMAGSIVWAVAPSVGWLAVSRAMAGMFGAQAALSSAVVADVTSAERRGPAMGVLGAAFGLSMILGPLLGGWVTHWVSHAAVGWAGAGLQALSVLTVVCLLPETYAQAADRAGHDRPRGSLRALWGTRGVAALLVATFCSTLALQQVTTTFSMLAEREYRFTGAEAGYAFALFGLVGTAVQGGVVRVFHRRFGDWKLAVAGLMCVVLSAGAIAAGPPLWGLWVSMGLIGGGVALSMPTVTALLSGRVGAERQGTLLGMHQGVMALGRGAGAPLAGVLFSRCGVGAPYLVAALTALAALLALWPTRALPAAEGAPPSELA